MRRMTIYLAAVMAALSAVGCKIDDGTSRDINRPARMLWNEVSWHIDDVMSICRHLSTLDAILSPEWAEIADKLELRYFDNAVITVDEKGVYDISIIGSYGSSVLARYRISTAGQPVSEDNPWSAIYTNGSSAADIVLTRDQAGLHLSLATDYNREGHHKAAIDLSYTVDPTRVRMSVTIDGGSGEIGDTEEIPTYKIAYDILSPLIYNSTGESLVSGKVEIAYDDLIEHTADRVRVIIKKGYPYYEYM